MGEVPTTRPSALRETLSWSNAMQTFRHVMSTVKYEFWTAGFAVQLETMPAHTMCYRMELGPLRGRDKASPKATCGS